jgi:subfamily B ATP-binding cassette protein HlyB/CyaB
MADRERNTLGGDITAHDFIWILGSLCSFHRIPFDATLVAQQFPPPHIRERLPLAARALGLDVREGALRPGTLERLSLPCVAFLVAAKTSEAGPLGDSAQVEHPVLLVRADRERVMYFAPGSETPVTTPVAALGATFLERVLQVTRAPQIATEDSDSPASASPAKFGFRSLVPELLKHKAAWRDVLIASFFIQLIGLATPLFTQVIIDKVVVHQTMSTLVVIAVALAIFLVFGAAMSWARQWLVIHTGSRVDAALGAQVFRHLFALPLRYFEHRPTGTLTARLHAVESIREFLSGAAVALVLDLPFLVVFLAIMFWYSWQLTLIAVGLLGLIALLSAVVTPVFRARLDDQFMAGARTQAFLTEYIGGMETVKSLQMEPQLQGRYGELLANYLGATFRTRTLANGYNVTAQALEQAMTLAILVMGALLVMGSDGFTIGALVAFQMFASRLTQPVMRIVGLWQEFQQASIAVKRLGDIMDAPTEPYTLLPSRAPGGHGRIDVRQLSFRYDENRPFLYRDFSLSVEAGRAVAIMGPSGSGKSTLAKLLQAFYQPTDGSIEIDGRDIRYLSANELRQYFGVVPQETLLFSGSIFDNLARANPLATFEDMVQACKMAELHDTIERLPQGYQTPIGEHGVGLSGGQKQRLAIARALLKRPKILVFDEATSSLDATTAESFARTINRLKGKATILFITHQLPRGLQVDRIVQIGANPNLEDAIAAATDVAGAAAVRS